MVPHLRGSFFLTCGVEARVSNQSSTCTGLISRAFRSHGMPRVTADRWAKRHELRLNPKSVIGPYEPLCEPTEMEVTALVKKLTPRLIRHLTTPESVALFLTEITAALQPS